MKDLTEYMGYAITIDENTGEFYCQIGDSGRPRHSQSLDALKKIIKEQAKTQPTVTVMSGFLGYRNVVEVRNAIAVEKDSNRTRSGESIYHVRTDTGQTCETTNLYYHSDEDAARLVEFMLRQKDELENFNAEQASAKKEFLATLRKVEPLVLREELKKLKAAANAVASTPALDPAQEEKSA